MEKLMIEDSRFSGNKVYCFPKALCSIARDGIVDDCDSCIECCNGRDGECRGCPIQECFNRLGEYEATDLTPEQILEVDKLYQELGREVMEYRKIGTVEECREAVEKHRIKKVLDKHPVEKYEIGECPSCNMPETSLAGYCGSCGQRLDWGDEE